MPPIDNIKITKSRPSLLGINPKLITNIYFINLFTVLQQFKKLLNPLVFINK